VREAGRRFAVIGDPVAHSLSPTIYAAAFRRLGVSASYEARRVPSGDSERLRRTLAGLSREGGGNVTVPHKEEAARLVDVRLPAARRTGAVNCFWGDRSGRVQGDNTDVGGFAAAIRDVEAPALGGADVLVLGAGGAARAVAVACLDQRVGRLDLLNRTPERAVALATELSDGSTARAVTGDEARSRTYDLVVNATSLGLRADDPLPLPLHEMSTRYALDLVYGHGGTRWTAHARSLGIPARDGLTMLVRQAALSLGRWFGDVVDEDDLSLIMFEAARAAVAGRDDARGSV
jgi:shikimate dehydrogenase